MVHAHGVSTPTSPPWPAGLPGAPSSEPYVLGAVHTQMTIRFLNCFTCSARVPARWHTGALCLLVETNRGLLLVDTGPGRDDYVHPPLIMRALQVVTKMPMDSQEAAANQLAGLGYQPDDVRHIVLTHMHFDHCGGLPDFPEATVHVHRREYEAFLGPWRHWLDVGYVRRHCAHEPDLMLHGEPMERWFGFPAISLPFEPPIYLVPLFGHTRGHCGVAIRTDSGWLFHVGGGAPINFSDDIPSWLSRPVTGTLAPRLRAFRNAHPDMQVTTGHMWSDFFEADHGLTT